MLEALQQQGVSENLISGMLTSESIKMAKNAVARPNIIIDMPMEEE